MEQNESRPGVKEAPKPATAADTAPVDANYPPTPDAMDAPSAAEEFVELSNFEYAIDRLPSWLTSLVFHLTALIVLVLITNGPKLEEAISHLNVASADDDALGQGGGAGNEPAGNDPPLGELDGHDALNAAPLRPIVLREQSDESDDVVQTRRVADPQIRLSSAALHSNDPQSTLQAAMPAELKEFGDQIMTAGELPSGTKEGKDNSFSGRLSAAGRADLVRSVGGTYESESAVSLALKWLAEHQMTDGGWDFDHSRCPKCKGRCANPGHMAAARNAATAIALLPFLGNGQTHKQGSYKKTVTSGLYFLTRAMRHQGQSGSLHERGGTMYAHGLAAIVLSEAYGMTHDPGLLPPAQAALNFISDAQDSVGGGWRYQPGQRGDTSVVGWQLMALKSGHMAYLQVSRDTVRRVGDFLDSVQTDYGAAYGYTDPGERPATTAIGLLCRMYLGWRHDNAALGRGVQMLSDWGPSTDQSRPHRNNMYYNYYATQVLHHYGGYPWKKWNEVLRDYLVKTQARRGHEQGSWYFDDSTDHGSHAGGRLYFTAMSAMTLEVYYRHMPLYNERSTNDDSFIKGR